ncbi:hypothetical protein [Streptomyces sp. NPDC101776]|uniref:hypothetical protein n=1 Tax=Streptomyces sp. NPDC101776 TaxID=3366146 RepID=UPI0037FC12FF
MTIIENVPAPTRNTPLAFARGILTGGVTGASSAAFVVGCVIESVTLCALSVGVPVVYGLLFFLAAMPRWVREAAVPLCTALARIETLEAVGGEATSDVAVRFDVTVAPDDGPAYRVVFKQNINLVDLSDYRPGSVVVVQYPQDRLWRVRIVKRPEPEWAERVAGAGIDSVPGPAVVRDPAEGCGAVGFVSLIALLLAAAAVILVFRADLFDEDTTAQPSVSSTSSTTVVSSASGTVALGAGQSFLDQGELRRAVGSLTKGKDTGRALTVVVQDRLLSVVFVPTGSQAPAFDPDSVPYERFPALVEEARSTLGVRSPATWQITVDRLAGSLTVRVGVTGNDGAASLEADDQGKVVRRTPVG